MGSGLTLDLNLQRSCHLGCFRANFLFLALGTVIGITFSVTGLLAYMHTVEMPQLQEVLQGLL